MLTDSTGRRRYELKRRAERQAKTRLRIVEAAVALHTSVGPAATSISAIARKAGVQRLTVYRHFPDERALLDACSTHYRAANPLPDPERWKAVRDPEDRLRLALADILAYHERTGPQRMVIMRDAAVKPELLEFAAPDLDRWRRVREALAVGWGQRGRSRAMLEAALVLATSVQTWRCLVREGGLSHPEAIELLVASVRRAAHPAAAPVGTREAE